MSDVNATTYYFNGTGEIQTFQQKEIVETVRPQYVKTYKERIFPQNLELDPENPGLPTTQTLEKEDSLLQDN